MTPAARNPTSHGRGSSLSAGLGRHKAIVVGLGVVVLFLYLRARSSSAAPSTTTTTTDPTAAAGGTASGAGSFPGTDPVAMALAGLSSGLGSLQTQLANEQAANEGQTTLLAQLGQRLTDMTNLGTQGPVTIGAGVGLHDRPGGKPGPTMDHGPAGGIIDPILPWQIPPDTTGPARPDPTTISIVPTGGSRPGGSDSTGAGGDRPGQVIPISTPVNDARPADSGSPLSTYFNQGAFTADRLAALGFGSGAGIMTPGGGGTGSPPAIAIVPPTDRGTNQIPPAIPPALTKLALRV